MMEPTKGPLNLDELFGQARAIKVTWKKVDYELLRMEAFGPKQMLRIEKLQRQARALQLKGDEVTDETAAALEQVIDELLSILCKDLPLDEIPFVGKMRIAAFYNAEMQTKNAPRAALKKATGRKSSAA